MNNKYNSPYSASVTGCGYMLDEMNNILPLLMSPEQDALLKKEIIENKYLMMNTENTRKRAVAEFRLRYNSVPPAFGCNTSPSPGKPRMWACSMSCSKVINFSLIFS